MMNIEMLKCCSFFFELIRQIQKIQRAWNGEVWTLCKAKVKNFKRNKNSSNSFEDVIETIDKLSINEPPNYTSKSSQNGEIYLRDLLALFRNKVVFHPTGELLGKVFMEAFHENSENPPVFSEGVNHEQTRWYFADKIFQHLVETEVQKKLNAKSTKIIQDLVKDFSVFISITCSSYMIVKKYRKKLIVLNSVNNIASVNGWRQYYLKSMNED